MKDSVVALCLTSIALACAGAYFLLYPYCPGDLSQRFTPEHVQLLQMFDSTHQQSAHRVLLFALLASIPLGTYARRFIHDGSIWQMYKAVVARRSGLAFAAVAIIATYSYWRALPASSIVHLQGGRYALGLIPSLTAYVLAIAGSIAFLALCAHRFRSLDRRRLSVTAALIVWVYLVVYFLMPCLLSPNFAGFQPDLITGIEWHYSGQLGPGDRLAAGRRLFDDVRIYSGFLPTLALALGENWLGFGNFGVHIHVVQLAQIVFLGLTLYAQRLWRPSDPLFLVLAFLLVAPWISTLHAGTLYPNQSAWRALAFPLGVVALFHLRRQPPLWRPFHVGVLLGLLILLNTEIGICVTGGFTAFQFSRVPKNEIGRIAAFLAFIAAGACFSFALWILVFRLGLGYWPVPTSAEQLFLLMRRFTAGYGGLQLRAVEPLPFLILCHSAFLVVLYSIRWWNRPLGPHSSARFAIACMIVLWFAYYAKGPQFWNLWTLLFLYSFLLSSIVRWSYFKSLSFGYRRLVRDWRMIALCLIILPAIAFSNLLLIPSAWRIFRPMLSQERIAVTEVSGVKLSKDLANFLLEKAQYVREARATYQDRVIFLTANSFSIPLLTGYFPALPFQDAFAETITHGDFELLKERITQASPDIILVDEPGSALSGYSEQQAFFSRLMRDLSASYQSAESSRGWQIWRRRG
jgi:hypothetical protein